MSLDASRAAWRFFESDGAQGPTATQRLVLVALADHADHDGLAWPSIDRLARRCGVSRRNVQKAVRALVASGDLERVVQGGPPPRGRIDQ